MLVILNVKETTEYTWPLFVVLKSQSVCPSQHSKTLSKPILSMVPESDKTTCLLSLIQEY